MNEVDNKDILVMKLIHYFMTKQDYVPIIIRGIENEIWLENPKGEFRIVRIVTKNIFNKEQYEFDSFKTKNIVSQIKKQTMNPFIDVLTIYVDMSDSIKNNMEDTKKYKYISVSDEKDLYKNDLINKLYKDIEENTKFKEEGYNLLAKITTDISKKNLEDNERLNSMYKQKTPIISYVLMVINVLIFILMYTIGNGTEDINGALIKFGALKPDLVRAGEYYRLLTSAFLHIGILHILCNMYALFSIGPVIEHFFGKIKFIFIYLYSALMGSLFVMVFSGDRVISAGASGAIFGLMGSLLYFGYSYRGYMGNKVINQILPVILLNLFIGFTTPGISNAAHIGGLLGGVVASFMLGIDEKQEKSKTINGIIIITILTAFMIYLSFFR